MSPRRNVIISLTLFIIFALLLFVVINYHNTNNNLLFGNLSPATNHKSSIINNNEQNAPSTWNSEMKGEDRTEIEQQTEQQNPSILADSKLNRLLTLGSRTSFDEKLLPSQDCGGYCFRMNGTFGKCPSLSTSSANIRCGVFSYNRRDDSNQNQERRNCNKNTIRKCSTISNATRSANSQERRMRTLLDFEKDVMPIAEKLLSSSSNSEQEVVDFFASSCESWAHPEKPKIWKTGLRLREKYPSAISKAGDCCLEQREDEEENGNTKGSATKILELITTTSHHLEEKDSSQGDAAAKKIKRDFQRIVTRIDFHNLKDFRSFSQAKSTTTHSRYSRASWVSLRNICMSCEKHSNDEEISKQTGIMNQKRNNFCQTVLWSSVSSSVANNNQLYNDAVKRLSAKSRGGRHSIFLQREASFIYGGEIPGNNNNNNATNEKNMKRKYVPGTTWYLPAFSVSNVGHAIHDGILGFVGSLFAREFYQKTSSPSTIQKPFQILMDEDFFESSSEFYSNVMTMTALKQKFDGIADPIMIDNFVSSALRQKMVCFDHLIVSGTDRTGSGSKFANKGQVAELLREAAFWYLANAKSIAHQRQQKKEIKIFVYGRSDLYRRKLDNFGALANAVREFVINSYQNDKHRNEASKPIPMKKVDDDYVSILGPILVSTFYSSPSSQIAMASEMDILLTAQGAHEQIVSLFGPKHQTIIEICPCQGTLTSFVGKYGMFLSNSNKKNRNQQRLIQMQICSPMINYVDDDVTEQNLMLCPHHFKRLQELLSEEVERIKKFLLTKI